MLKTKQKFHYNDHFSEANKWMLFITGLPVLFEKAFWCDKMWFDYLKFWKGSLYFIKQEPSLVRRRLRESQAGGRCVPSQSLYVQSQANTCLSGRVARGWAPRAITGMFGTKDTVKSFQFRDDQEITCSWKKKAQCLPHFQLGSFLLSVLEYCQLYVLRSVLQPSAESWKLT